MSDNITKRVGLGTAYGFAKAGGYEGTVAEFTELLGNIAIDLARIENLSVTVTTLPAGSQATASLNGSVLSLGIPKGDKGDKGNTGDTGSPAGFGTVSATVDANIGAPSVEVTASGADTAKNFAFAFHNLKGEKGDKGDPGDVSQAQLDAAVSDLKSDIDLIKDCALPQNLFDASKIVQGGYWSNSGTITPNANSYYSTQYIPVDSGVEYTFTDDSNAGYLATYDSGKNFITRVDPDGTTYTPATGTKYVRWCLYNKAFPSGFKFAKTSDFDSVSSDYVELLNGAKILEKSVSYDAFSDNTILDIVGNIASANEVTELNLSFPSYTKVSDTYFNASGNLTTSSSFTLLYFVAPFDFDVWGDTGTTSSAGDDLMLIKYSDLPMSSSTALISRKRQRRDDDDGTIIENTLPSQDSPLTVSRGEILAVAVFDNKDFTLYTDGLYDGFTLNSNVIAEKNIYVKVGTDSYSIRLNGFDIALNYEVDAETRKDAWLIRGIKKGNQTICTSGTDIVGVLKEVGQSDYMGGLHGDETNVIFGIYADGTAVTDDTYCKQLDVFMYSHLTRPSTGDNVIDRVVHLIFKDNHIDVETTFICLVDNFNLDQAFNGGMFAWIDTDATFQMSNMGIIDSESGTANVTLQASAELYSASAIINGSVVTVENVIGHEKSSFLGETYYYGASDKRIKMYYATDHNSIWNTGHICKGKARYTLN